MPSLLAFIPAHSILTRVRPPLTEADLFLKWEPTLGCHTYHAQHPTFGPMHMGCTREEARLWLPETACWK